MRENKDGLRSDITGIRSDKNGIETDRNTTLENRNGIHVDYDDIKKKLIERGVPPSEIAYIHDTDNGMKSDNGKKLKPDEAKLALFSKVRKGEVRFLLGSTEKMGVGMNVQTKLCALHHVDVPWIPSEEEHTQRYIHQKPSKINRYQAMQQPAMTCRYRVSRFFFILTNFGETIMITLINCTHSTTRQYMIEGFTTAKDMAQRWNVTTRTVQILCSEGRIEGATKFGDVWAIPVNAEKPTDNRVRTGMYKNWRKKKTAD